MYDVRELQPGDVVRIVDAWPVEYNRQASGGAMDKWLGHEMTVKSTIVTNGDRARPMRDCVAFMVEDDGEFCGDGWSWLPEMIECVVSYADQQEYTNPSDDAFFSFIYG